MHIQPPACSYILFTAGLPCPHIAAGDNLALPLIGAWLRKCGAWFIRRTTRGAKDGSLYKRVLAGERCGAAACCCVRRLMAGEAWRLAGGDAELNVHRAWLSAVAHCKYLQGRHLPARCLTHPITLPAGAMAGSKCRFAW